MFGMIDSKEDFICKSPSYFADCKKKKIELLSRLHHLVWYETQKLRKLLNSVTNGLNVF